MKAGAVWLLLMGKHFFKPHNKDGDSVFFDNDTAHHMVNVLRLSLDQDVLLCDGFGTDYTAKVTSVTRKPASITLTLLNSFPCHTEPPIPVTLYQSIPKGDKMDWIIEKCIEVGVSTIVPVYASRSEAKFKDPIKKMERYNRIAYSAASQSMRGVLPKVLLPMSFKDALRNDTALTLVAYEKEQGNTIKSTLCKIPPEPISVWIGPEGGFESTEINCLSREKSAFSVSLGASILRTETAGVVALAQILCIWGQ